MITVTWATKIIYVPKSFLTLISGSRYKFDLDDFRLALKDLEDSEEGMGSERTHNHVAPISVGAVTLARVVEIINGYTITFEDGANSAEYDGANTNAADVVNVNQVSVRPNNSAGLTYSSIQEDLAYNGVVHLDVTGSSKAKSGLGNYVGTRPIPSNNLEDAIAIANKLNIKTFMLSGDLVLDRNVSGYDFKYDKNASIDFNNQMTYGSRFTEMEITGVQNGLSIFYDCRITSVTNLLGVFETCKFLDDTPLILASGIQFFNNCRSGVAGNSSPVFDCSNGGMDISFRAYSGGIKLVNYADAANECTIEFIAGKLNLDSSDTAGTIHARGVYHYDKNGETCTVVQSGKASGVDGITKGEFLALK